MSGNVNTLVIAAAALPVERVAIIGGGTMGLLLAHAPLSSNICNKFAPTMPAATTRMDVNIFESQSGFDNKMSGLGIQLPGQDGHAVLDTL